MSASPAGLVFLLVVCCGYGAGLRDGFRHLRHPNPDPLLRRLGYAALAFAVGIPAALIGAMALA